MEEPHAGPEFAVNHLKVYHEMLLKDGALPLPVLEQKVDDYIKRVVAEAGAARGGVHERAR